MIDDKNFGDDLLHKIKEDKISPKPRWHFLLKDYIVWGLGLIALLLGAVASALLMYMLNFNEIGAYGFGDNESLETLMAIVPLFWIIFLGIFVGLVYYNIKHTKNGYRYSPLFILSSVFVASICLGALLNMINFGEKIDDLLGDNMPFYDQIINPNVRFWSNPQRGRITGIITAHATNSNYILVDVGQNEWELITENAVGDINKNLIIGQPARFSGKIQGEHKFIVNNILPAPKTGKGFLKHLKEPAAK